MSFQQVIGQMPKEVYERLKTAVELGIPVVPGSAGEVATEEDAQQCAVEEVRGALEKYKAGTQVRRVEAVGGSAKEKGKNIYVLGLLARMFDLTVAKLTQLIKERFGGKNEDIVRNALLAFDAGGPGVLHGVGAPGEEVIVLGHHAQSLTKPANRPRYTNPVQQTGIGRFRHRQ